MNITSVQYAFLKKNRFKPFIVAFVLFLLLAVSAAVMPGIAVTPLRLVWALLWAVCCFRLFRTGDIARARRTVFSMSALTGIVIAVTALIYPRAAAPALAPLFLVAAGALVSGKLWCSWACPFGGIDDACASLSRTLPERPGRLTLILAAFLKVGLMTGAVWLIYTALYPELTPYMPASRTVTAALIGAVLVLAMIVLPLLTGRRFFCSLVCPARGLVRMTGQAHPLGVRIDRERCTGCGDCRDVCRESAIGTDFTVGRNCSTCLRCFTACTHEAIDAPHGMPLLLLAALWISGTAFMYYFTAALRLLTAAR